MINAKPALSGAQPRTEISKIRTRTATQVDDARVGTQGAYKRGGQVGAASGMVVRFAEYKPVGLGVAHRRVLSPGDCGRLPAPTKKIDGRVLAANEAQDARSLMRTRKSRRVANASVIKESAQNPASFVPGIGLSRRGAADGTHFTPRAVMGFGQDGALPDGGARPGDDHRWFFAFQATEPRYRWREADEFRLGLRRSESYSASIGAFGRAKRSRHCVSGLWTRS